MKTLNPLTHAAARTIRVAAVQMHSCLGDIKANLSHAVHFIERAARDGAELVVLPELSASGYSLSPILWNAAERRDGFTVHWLGENARRFHIHLGIGFIEAEGEDFFNTFALAAPDGQIVGFIRKTMAETNLFKCAIGSHTVNTSIGKIGIGICADNHFVPMVRQMQAESVDLMLMPHANPGPFKVGGLVSQKDIDTTRAKARNLATLYAHLLGVPVIFANQVGPRGSEKWGGILGRMMNPEQIQFLGLSTIADLDGVIKAPMDDCSEGVITADVTLDPSRKVQTPPLRYGRYGGGWVDPGASSNAARDLICYIDSFFGRLNYQLSSERRQKARHIASSEGYL